MHGHRPQREDWPSPCGLGMGHRLGFVILITLSGFAALIYQVAWTRRLTVLFGTSTYAVATVLAAFLGGLALGAWILGSRLDRSHRPLRAYAILEIGIGLYGFLFPFLIHFVTGIYVAWGQALDPSLQIRTLMRATLAAMTLLPPTFLMGATLPAMCRILVRQENSLGRDLGFVYAFNTLGAAIGALVAGFLLLPWLGIQGSIFLAAVINLIVAAAALGLAREEIKSTALVRSKAVSSPRRPVGETGRENIVLAAMAVSGFAALGYEVLWTRALITTLHTGFTYAFSLMLATFLTGLVLGSFLYARYFSRSPAPLLLLSRTQLALGGWALLTIWLLGRMPFLVSHAAEKGLLPFIYTWKSWIGEVAAASSLVMLIPTILLGICFPLAARLVVGEWRRVGHGVGKLFAANTLGSILGSLAAGFYLAPKFGTLNSLLILAGLNLVVGVGLSWRGGAAIWERRTATLAVVAILAGSFMVTPREYYRESISQGRGGRLLYFEEDLTGVVEIYDVALSEGGYSRRLFVNGTSYASTGFYPRRYHKLLGHLPALLHPAPRRSLVIAFGTGMTASALTSHQEVEQVDGVDLSPAVFGGVIHFAAFNRNVAHDPKLRMLVEDGRNHLLLSDDAYDLITLEPPPPRYAGVSSLYSRDFYLLSRDRLEPGGVVAQWIPMHSHTEEEMRMLIRAFVEVFPHSTLWLPTYRDAILVGSTRPVEIDLERIRNRMQQPAVAEDLADIDVSGPLDLAATLFADGDTLNDYVRGVIPITDDWPVIEYFAGQEFVERQVHLARLMPHRLREEALEKRLKWGNLGDSRHRRKFRQDVKAMGHFYRGIILGDRGNHRGRWSEWFRAMQTAPDRPFYRTILRPVLERARQARRSSPGSGGEFDDLADY